MRQAIPENIRHLNRHYEPRHFATRADWLRYARWLRRHARVSLGLLPEPRRTPLDARVFGLWKGDGFTCEKVAFESIPGFYVTGNLFRPAGRARRGRAPAILCPHGHWEDGRLHDHDPRGSVVARCIRLAQMGATAFSWDMVGYNDSCQLPHREFGADAYWGLSLMALQTWNGIRSLDFLLTLAEVDPGRIGVTGASGGGTQTFVLTAVDGRVAAAAPICMISYQMQGGCLCENAPLLRIDATSVDLARLFAPKPLFMGSCTRDWTKDTIAEELPAVREVYALSDAAERVSHLHVDAEHGYNLQMRESVYGWFNKVLFGAKSAEWLAEGGTSRPPLRDRMVWWGRKRPPELPFAALRKIWRRRAEDALRPHLRTPAAARKNLGPLLPHALGVTLTSVDECRRKRPRGIRVEREGDSLIITPAGRARDVSRLVEFYTAYNRCFVADRVHEILAAVEGCPGRTRLVGRGKAGLWCLVAGAISRRVKALDVDVCGFDPSSDAAWTEHLDVPAIRQVGGLATALALVGDRPLELRNASPEVRRLAGEFAR